MKDIKLMLKEFIKENQWESAAKKISNGGDKAYPGRIPADVLKGMAIRVLPPRAAKNKHLQLPHS